MSYRRAAALPFVALVVGLAAPARADNVLYGELLGKGGPWGLGFEHALTPRIGVGAVGSIAVLDEQQLYTFAPYVHLTIVRGARHRLFTEVGAELVHSRVPSPVMSWDGMTDTGGGGVLTLGYELATRRTVTRVYGELAAGEGGVLPWLGIAFGVRL